MNLRTVTGSRRTSLRGAPRFGTQAERSVATCPVVVTDVRRNPDAERRKRHAVKDAWGYFRLDRNSSSNRTPARYRLDDIRLEARTELQRAIGYGREVLRAGMANFVEIS